MADDKKLVLSQSSEDVVNILDKAILNDKLGDNLKIDSDGKLDLKQEITTAKSLSVADEAERLALGTINNLYIVRQLDDNEHDYYLNAGLDASDNANWNIMTRDKEYTGDDIVYTDEGSGVRYIIHIKNGEPYGLAVPDGFGTLSNEPVPLVMNADNMYIKDESLSNKYYLHADNGIFSIKDGNGNKYDSIWWGSGHIGTEGIFHNGTDSVGTDHTIGMYTNDGQGNFAPGIVTSDSALAIGLNNGVDRPFYATKDKIITTSIEPIVGTEEIGSELKPFQHANIKGVTLTDETTDEKIGLGFKDSKLIKRDGDGVSEIGGLYLFVEDIDNNLLEPTTAFTHKLGSLEKPMDVVRSDKFDVMSSASNVGARIDGNSTWVDFDIYKNLYFKRDGSIKSMSIMYDEEGVYFDESPRFANAQPPVPDTALGVGIGTSEKPFDAIHASGLDLYSASETLNLDMYCSGSNTIIQNNGDLSFQGFNGSSYSTGIKLTKEGNPTLYNTPIMDGGIEIKGDIELGDKTYALGSIDNHIDSMYVETIYLCNNGVKIGFIDIDSNNLEMRLESGIKEMRFGVNGSNAVQLAHTGSYYMFAPYTNEGCYLGNATYKWKKLYSSGGYTTSDRRLKNVFENKPDEFYLDWLEMTDSGNCWELIEDGFDISFGWIAQDVVAFAEKWNLGKTDLYEVAEDEIKSIVINKDVCTALETKALRIKSNILEDKNEELEVRLKAIEDKLGL